jgi:acetyl esterase/lipase
MPIMSLVSKTLFILSIVGVLLVALVACSPLKTLNALSSNSNTRIVENLAYGDGARHQLDIYAPENAKDLPVVIFFYGGSWNSGSRTDYAFVGHALASRGMVAVLADYRLYPEVRYPAFLEDGAQAVAWTAREIARFGGDPQRMFIMGHSAGAYNAAMLALDQRWLAQQGMTPAIFRGWIGLAGPYDFLPIVNPDVRPVFFHPNTPPESQPINHVTAGAPPALLIAARNDNLVNPARNTGGLTQKLHSLGVPATEIYYDNVSHASLVATLSTPLRALAPTLDEVTRFVKTDGGRKPAAE